MGIAFDGRKTKRHMGQRYAKHQMQSGVRVYHQRHYQQAIARWRTALSRLRFRNAEDRFITLGYMAQAFCDCSDYESMLHYALQQMELANARHDDFMKSEALLNLSKAYERLADYGKAINYGRASLQHPNIDARTPGYAHLGIALAHLGLSQFQTALEEFERAMAIAGDTGDKLLELQICVGLGTLFTLLRDLSKALIFLRNALSILQLVTADNVHAKYKSTILYQLSVVLRLKGSLADARQVCDEALRLAYQTSNRATYARALSSMADINRELGESEAKETITKSWARYEQAFRIMRQIKDRMGEAIVLGSMAKSASESRSHYTGQCECQAIQLNRKCLELAKMIGCKHAMMKCHLRLQELYGQLEDDDSEEAAARACVALIQEMELFCNFCGQRYGDRDDSLQALRCSHIFHEKCLHKFLAEGEDLSCPKCKRKAIVMENLHAQTSSTTSPPAEQFVRDSVLANSSQLEAQNDISALGQRLIGFRNPLKLTPLNIPIYESQQAIPRQQMHVDAQEEIQQQQQHRETTAPPTLDDFEVSTNRAAAKATVRIPRTTSVPITGAGATGSDVIYASGDYLRACGTTGDVFTLANRIIESEADSLRYDKRSPPAAASGAGTIRTIKAARSGNRPRSAGFTASAARLGALEIGAETCTQEFSLSASTSSIAFFPAPAGAPEKLTSQCAPKVAQRDDSGATSGASTSGSSDKNSPPVSALASRRLPSRAERMRALAAGRHQFASEDSGGEIAAQRAPFALTFQKQPATSSFGRTNSSLGSTSGADSGDGAATTKRPKPPPPPRKPCCGSGSGAAAGSAAFPTFSDELLNAPLPSLAFPSMLERAMRTVLEEESEDALLRSGMDAADMFDHPAQLPNLRQNSLAQDAARKPPASDKSSDLQNHDDKRPNCIDGIAGGAPSTFVVRHGAGVTDL